MRLVIAAGLFGVLGLLWTVRAQVVHPTPSPGTGVVTVAGTVEIANIPSVRATQSGDWTVSLSNNATVTMASPEFLRSSARYEVIWPNGDRETVVVEQIGRDGWVRVDPRRWINLATARSVEGK